MDKEIVEHFKQKLLQVPRRIMQPDLTIIEIYGQPERSKREDHESGCGALNTVETQ